MTSISETIEYSNQFLKDRKDLNGVDIASSWRLLMTKEEIISAVKRCAKKINEKFSGQKVTIVCVLNGAICFVADLIEYLDIPYTVTFVKVSSYRSNQTRDENNTVVTPLDPISTKYPAIVCDELFDKGLTFSITVNGLAKEMDRNKIFTCALFKKNTETEYPEPDIIGINVPDVWLVGYGLDDKEEKRGWKTLYACPKIETLSKTHDDAIFGSLDDYNEARMKILDQLKL